MTDNLKSEAPAGCSGGREENATANSHQSTPNQDSAVPFLAPDVRLITAHVEGLFREAEGVVGDLRCSAFRRETGKDLPFYARAVHGEAFVSGHHNVRITDDPASLRDAVKLLTTIAADAARCASPAVVCPPPVLFKPNAPARLEQIVYAPVLVLDADPTPNEARRIAEDLLGPATWIARSGSDWVNPATSDQEAKLHLYWRFREPARTPSQIELVIRLFRELVTRVQGADRSITPAHCMRLWGSTHTKNRAAPRVCILVEDRDAVRLDIGQAERVLCAKGEHQRQDDHNSFKMERDAHDEDPRLASAAEEAQLTARLLQGQNYHDALLRIGARRVVGGASPELVIAYLEGLMDAVPEPLRDGGEVGRWKARRSDIPRIVAGIRPPPEPDMTLLMPERIDPPALPSDFLKPFSDGDPILERWAYAAAEARGAPVDYIVGALLPTAASLLSGVDVRESADWEEPLVLWSMLVGDPSAGKSPALKAVTKALKPLETEVRAAAQREVEEWQDAKEAARENKETFDDPKPVVPDLSVTDATTEKLCEIIATQGRGLLLPLDELAGWLANFSRYSGGDDRPFWLEAYGAGAYKTRRLKREASDVERLTVSITGCIQPERLYDLLLRSPDDGLTSRFMYFFPDPAPIRMACQTPDTAVMVAAFARLHSVGASHVLDLDHEARAALLGLRTWVRDEEEFADRYLKGVLGKVPGLVMRLSGLLTLLHAALQGDANVPTVVTRVAIERATSFAKSYLIPMAKRVIGATSVPGETRGARLLARLIVEERLDTFTTREIQRRERAHLKRREELEEAIDVLVQAGWVRLEKGWSGKKGGRPQHVWRTDPRVFELAKGYGGFRGSVGSGRGGEA